MPWSYPYTNILKRLIQTFGDCSNNIRYHLHLSHSPYRWYLRLKILIFLNVSLSFVLTLQSAGTATTIILDSILLPHSLCQALRWYSGDALKSRAKIRLEGREGERWGREKWEREPVSISLTTLFRPFLSRLDSAVKTVNTSVSYNHSQVSRARISRDANFFSANVLKFYVVEFVILWEHPVFWALVSSFTRRSDDRKYVCHLG